MYVYIWCEYIYIDDIFMYIYIHIFWFLHKGCNFHLSFEVNVNEISRFTLSFSQGQSRELDADALRAGSGTRSFFVKSLFLGAMQRKQGLCRINNMTIYSVVHFFWWSIFMSPFSATSSTLASVALQIPPPFSCGFPQRLPPTFWDVTCPAGKHQPFGGRILQALAISEDPSIKPFSLGCLGQSR